MSAAPNDRNALHSLRNRAVSKVNMCRRRVRLCLVWRLRGRGLVIHVDSDSVVSRCWGQCRCLGCAFDVLLGIDFWPIALTARGTGCSRHVWHLRPRESVHTFHCSRTGDVSSLMLTFRATMCVSRESCRDCSGAGQSVNFAGHMTSDGGVAGDEVGKGLVVTPGHTSNSLAT